MAADQRDLRPLNLSPQQQQQQWGAPQSPQSPKKVKFLCSFGGKILPRPSDGALRYVGGHTRIISVPKDLPFHDLMAKMSEVIGGGPVILKYQLPNEDLDALISVSCLEDLENMIDEYDKLVESSPDGSVKLRAFLFPPSDCSADLGVVDMSDTGQRYYEAVNGIGASIESGGSSSIGSLKRKDSGLSAGSSNSGVGIDAADGISSDCLTSPQTVNYLDPNQVQFLNAQPVNSQASNLKQAENFRPLQPLSQLPPLPPAYQNLQGIEGYGLNSSVAVNQGQGVRFDDCYMCQKMLPHAHSDGLVQNLGSGSSPGAASPASYSQQSEPPLMTLADNAGEVHPNYGFPQVQYEGEMPYLRKMENLDHARAFIPSGSVSFSPDMHAQPPYELFMGNFRQEEPQMLLLQQQQQQQGHHQQQQPQLRQPQLLQNLAPPHHPVQQELITTQFAHNVSSGRNTEGLPEYANEYGRPIQGMMEGLRLSPTETSGSNFQGNAAGAPDSSPLIVDGTYAYVPQVGGNMMMPSRAAFSNVGVVPERNYVRPLDQIPQAASDHTYMQNLHVADPSQVYSMMTNQGPFPHHLGLRMAPPIPSEGLLGVPSYTSGVDSTYTDREVTKVPIGERKDESTHLYSKDLSDYSPVLQSGNVPFSLPNAGSPTGLVETFQESAATDSLFCNQDPRKILGGAHPLPPRPRRVASRESITPRDTGVQIHTGNSTASDIIALLEEGGLHPSPDSLNKDSHLDPVQSNKGSGDEQIKQDLQAVAEGVASSVLNSSFPQAPVFFAHDTPELKVDKKFNEDNAEQQESQTSHERKIEDNKPKIGFQITDDIERGRLQIIKNSDLEELRELGSGTFGTVYHGKWRGTDVAIKRINDRCFAGKPSEQERMRADFWNEASKLADLHHPNVVAFYGVVLDGPGGSVATVTEYMVNGSLRNALQRNDKALDRRRRLIIAMDVAFGMEYLHGKNIVHFDLKSDNLLVNLRDPQRPICKVGDLGLSKVKCQTLISGGVRGTLPWMAPELLNGSSSLVSEKVDVFSFGIVMWELLTGEEPYADLHYGAIIGGIVSNTLRPPVPESCDPEWRALMERCWSADPSERPSFTGIVESLRSMATSLPQKGQTQAQIHK